MLKKIIALVTAVVVLAVSFPVMVCADTDVAQSGQNPIVFDQTAATDNLIQLMAAGSQHNSGLSVTNYGSPKHFWINNFNDNTNDYLKWTVSLAEGANYHVWALLNSGSVVPLKLTVDGTSHGLDASTRSIGWDKLDMGTLFIPGGTSTLKLVRSSSGGGNIEIKSLELIRESDRAAYEQRIAGFKKDTSWLANAKYGLMFQYGAWGYPQTGNTRKSIDQGAADFDVRSFVDMVKGTGASYVIWSITWWQYWMQAPSASVDGIMGNSSLTASRDLIGEVAQACHDNGIRFMLYYHQGIQQEPAWAAKQNWPSSFTATGTGDRSTFFDNWCSVITEMGNRYGTNLDGWFFDDGCVYYPAPFERLGAAARAGNPDRLISYNPWVSVRITDFQDVYFAEESHGETQFGSAPAGGNGVFTDGPQKGLLQQAMFTMEQDWGVHSPNTAINTGITGSQAAGWLNSAIPRKVPLSFNMMMWEDGTVAQSSLDVLEYVKNPSTGSLDMKNNTDSGITYSGAWRVSSGRGVGDYMDDVSYTSGNNDSFEYAFAGTGVEYITEKNSDQGKVDIYIDGVFQQTVDCYNAARLTKQTVYGKTGLAPGRHTIKGVKTSGQYMLLDALRVLPLVVNDSGDGITYSGQWNYSKNRGAGDYSDDVHYAGTNGASVEYSFTGTGIEVIAPKDNCQGNVDIYLDGVFQKRINTYNSAYLAQQVIYSANSLTPGTHTVKMVKVDGSWMQLDALKIY